MALKGQGRAHQKREVHTSTAQLLLCIAAGEAAVGAAAEEEKARSTSSESVWRRKGSAGSEGPRCRRPNAMLAAGASAGSGRRRLGIWRERRGGPRRRDGPTGARNAPRLDGTEERAGLGSESKWAGKLGYEEKGSHVGRL